ncbi:gastrula zinc finger protein XlCGF17.1-like [Synchiropus splendidus]|uniref:gastrula zinc finger protein XlCGF17.1-like n=1 Tax=Synchiropus splendidus TaxID=270530 RepID=UPI00237D86BD|nr:gastrula zinc finger protein XlCGF17.1-like [Synchiropus splendidus]
METPGPDVLLRVIKKEEEWSFSLNQEQQEPHLIKEDDRVKVEEEATQFSVTSVAVKSEDDGAASSWTQHPDPQRSLSSESDTDDSEDWRESIDAESGSKGHVSEKKDDADGMWLVCSRCGKKCSSRGGLTKHIKSCGGTVSCWVCGKYFKTSRKMNCHLKIHPKIHSEKPFVCSLCGRRFERRHCLKQHVRIHTGEKPYSCTVCDKRFRTASQLTLHIRTHTGEKPYRCSQCGSSFTYKGSLKDHVRRHTGEKPFICTLCGHCFVRRDSLKDHMKTHDRVKSFHCAQCGECFKWKKLLRSHMKTHSSRTADSLEQIY